MFYVDNIIPRTQPVGRKELYTASKKKKENILSHLNNFKRQLDSISENTPLYFFYFVGKTEITTPKKQKNVFGAVNIICNFSQHPR